MHLENNPLKDKGWAKLVWKTGMLGLNTLYYPLVPGQTLPNNCYLCEGGRNSNTVEGRHAPMPSRHIAQPTRPISAQHCSCSASARSHSPIPSKGEEKAVAKRSMLYRRHTGMFGGVQDSKADPAMYGILCLMTRIQYIERRNQKRVEALGMIQGQFLGTH